MDRQIQTHKETNTCLRVAFTLPDTCDSQMVSKQLHIQISSDYSLHIPTALAIEFQIHEFIGITSTKITQPCRRHRTTQET